MSENSQRRTERVHCNKCLGQTPAQLQFIETAFRSNGLDVIADCILFLAFSGVRITEALELTWQRVDWQNGVIHVRRQKRGVNPWVPILPEMETLLKSMMSRASGEFLFPAPNDPETPVAYETVYHALRQLCLTTKMKYVTPHGLRSFFVTQCRESGLSDADIAMLIGDKSGPAIIARTYYLRCRTAINQVAQVLRCRLQENLHRIDCESIT